MVSNAFFAFFDKNFGYLRPICCRCPARGAETPRRLGQGSALAIMAGIPNAKIAEGFNAKGAKMHFKVIGVLCVAALCALCVKKTRPTDVSPMSCVKKKLARQIVSPMSCVNEKIAETSTKTWAQLHFRRTKPDFSRSRRTHGCSAEILREAAERVDVLHRKFYAKSQNAWTFFIGNSTRSRRRVDFFHWIFS